jgi:hypothetical protein
MVAAIISCEIGFWVLLVGGLAARYLLRARRLSTVLLVAVPLVDVALLGFAVADLRRGGTPSVAHGLSAVYLGTSIAFGHRMMRWSDQRFAHRFAGGPPPERPPRAGREHAAHERAAWGRHLLAYLSAAATLGLFTALAGGLDRTLPLWQPMGLWTIVLAVDFVVAFSYTLSPRAYGDRDPSTSRETRS